MKTVEKTWGRETWLENNEKYCLKIIVCVDRKWSSEGDFHHHPIKDETFIVVNGELLLDIEGKVRVLKQWDRQRISPGVNHRFRSVGLSCSFLEVSTSHSDEDTVRVPYKEKKDE
jgi:N-acetylneuraminate synthase